MPSQYPSMNLYNRFGEKINLIPYNMNTFFPSEKGISGGNGSMANDQYNTPKYTLDYSMHDTKFATQQDQRKVMVASQSNTNLEQQSRQ